MLKICRILLVSGVLAFCLAPALPAQNMNSIRGTVENADGSPFPGAEISFSTITGDRTWRSSSDAKGRFHIMGLPQGRFIIACEAGGASLAEGTGLDFAASRSLFVKLKLVSRVPGGGIVIDTVLHDPDDLASATAIDESQMRLLPSGNSIWSLIENQDFSATTNRIDVGGLWNGLPGLFSARGSASWTQNEFRLNGMSVTDPYSGGLPLLYPDFHSLQSVRLENAGHSALSNTPGGVLDLATKEGGGEYRGTVSAFFSNKVLSSSNITPALQKEGLLENHTLNDSLDAHFDLSGPLVPGKLFFYTSWTGLKVSRNIADFAGDDKSSVYSGLAKLRYEAGRSSWSFLWTGQAVKNPTYGAGRNVPFAATLDQKDTYNVFQSTGTFILGDRHVLALGAGFSRADNRSRFQDDARGQHGIEVFRNLVTGPASAAGQGRRELLTFFARGEFMGMTGPTSHRFEYGGEVKRSASKSLEEVRDNIHVRFFEGLPLEVVKFNSPGEHRESSLDASAFVQETLTLPGHFSAMIGLNVNYTDGKVSGGKTGVRWLHAAPRVGLVIPFTRSGKTAVKAFAGRNYFGLPLSYLTYGNPNAPGGLAYSWQDKNRDGLFEDGETGTLLRREGPFYAGIDPSLKRPHTDELSVGIAHQSGRGLTISLTGYLRETRDLVETLNTGVPFTSYEPRVVTDIGDDRVPGNYDDLSFLLYDQSESTLGKDFLLLTNPGSDQRYSRYKGLDLVLLKRTSRRFAYFVSLTATEATGTTSPGNTERENDDGVVGALYDNPNTLVNAKGRMRFDRAYTGRIGLAVRLPLDLQLGYIMKYYDGQPFARKIVVTGFRQGPFTIMAHPRGVSRYEFNMTHDLRLQRSFRIGRAALRVILDGFNIFNQHLATEEYEWTDPDFPLRFATEIQSPRVFRLGLSYEF
jgi:hypothetical protein